MVLPASLSASRPYKSNGELIRLLGLALILIMTIATTFADENDPDTLPLSSPTSQSDPTQSQPELSILKQKIAGQPIRTLGMYQSQMDELIPKDFLPIDVDRLIRGLSTRVPDAQDSRRDQFDTAVYWIDVRDDVLASRRSEIHIDSSDSMRSRRSLGPVNFAIEPPVNRDPTDDSDNTPRLENESNGDLVVVLPNRPEPVSKIQFKWQLRGKSIGSGHRFDLQLPPTAQTRIVLAASPEVELISLDGVLRARSGPPPDADTFASAQQKRWYELDAGGLSRIRIRTSPSSSSASEDPWIVRNNFMQYDVDPTGLNWICRMLVNAADQRRIPKLLFRDTTVTSISVNSFDVPFTSTLNGIVQSVQIEAPESVLESAEGLTEIAIRGVSSTRSNGNTFELPMPYWLGNVKLASTVDQVQMLVSKELQIVRWDLPQDWTIDRPASMDDGTVVHAASGPPPSQAITGQAGSASVAQRQHRAWSRVRFSRPPRLSTSDTALRLEWSDGSVKALARMVVMTNLDQLSPFRIAIEPNWVLDSITYVHSSRAIEKPVIAANSQTVTLWPEATDIDNGQMILELSGVRTIESETGELTIPSSWFAAPHSYTNKLVAAIVRPSELNWIRNATVSTDLISASALPESAKNFLGDLPTDTLFFQPEFGRTPAVSLQQPIATFDAQTQFYVSRDREELIEDLEIEIASSGEPLDQIVVQTGPPDDRPAYVWSLGDRQNNPRIRLPKSAISYGTGEQAGLYTINLTDQSLRGKRLMGRRTYRARDQQTVHLPTVVGATSVQSFAWIESAWTVSHKPYNLRTVLVDTKNPLGTDAPVSLIAAETFASSDWVGLQYDKSNSPKITLTKSDQKKHVAIVRREQVQVVASSRGVDRIEASFEVAPSVLPVRIDFEPTLQLVAMSRDDTPVVLSANTQKFLMIPPRSKTESIRLTWNRDQYENRWLRTCRIPKILTSGIVLQSEYNLIPASDAFAPAVLLHGLPTSNQRYSTIDLQPGDRILLIRRNIVLAMGWLIAMLVFAFGWHVANSNPLMLSCMVVVVAVAILLWWPWRLALIGWLMVPMIAAGMLATARNFQLHGRKSNPKHPLRDASATDTSDTNEGDSKEFSVQTVFRLLPWIWMITVAGTNLVAQQPPIEPAISTGSTAVPSGAAEISKPLGDGSINVLVPVDPSGKQAGNTVYVHKSIHKQITQPRNSEAPLEPAYQSARYRVRLDTSLALGQLTNYQIIEAEFLINLQDGQRNTNSVRLPFPATSVRRIELMGKRYRLIRVDAHFADSVVVALPRGNSFRIRATLIADTVQVKTWNKVSLPIPKVAASQLIVESDKDYEVIRIGGVTGEILAASDHRRWVELIGPCERLEIEYPAIRAKDNDSPTPLRRRYIIDAGLRTISVDCQIDSTEEKTLGDSFQFMVLDDRVPLITSKHWQLEQTELLGPMRRRMTLRSNHDDPGPIHLHWSQAVQGNGDQGLESYSIVIPEVVANGQAATADAWIALRSDAMLQYAPLIDSQLEPLSIDHFNAAWNGYRVGLDRAYVAVGVIPRVVVQRKPRIQTTVVQQHYLHVTSDQLQLEYKATLTPAAMENGIPCLRFPIGLRLQELLINGAPRPFQPTRHLNYTEVALGDLRHSETVELQVSAILPMGDNAQFVPPAITVHPARLTSAEYLISRDPWIAIDGTKHPLLSPAALPSQTAVDWLSDNRSPAMSWRTNDQDQPQSLGTYQIETLPRQFNCQQLISIDRQDSLWAMQASIAFESEQVPDVIDIDLPTRWCDALQVEGALQWILIDINDPQRQIIRIRYDKQTVANRALTIRGRLQQTDTARLSVPSILVLGSGHREVYIDTPNQSPAGDPIQWQTNGVESSQLPDRWRTNGADTAVVTRSHFVCSAPNWSVELAPLPEANDGPIAYLFDGNIFAQPDGALLHASWDLSPGPLDRIDLMLPQGTKVLAAWSAGRPIEVQLIDTEPAPQQSGQTRIRIPLSVSRLPQPVEVLLQVSSAAAKQGNYIPEMIDVPVTRKWLVQHVPKHQTSKYELTKSALSFSNLTSQSQMALAGQRHLSLASSIIESVDAVDRVAGPSPREVTTLLQQWSMRYQTVRALAQPGLEQAATRAQWETNDATLEQHLRRHGIEIDVTSMTDSDKQTFPSLALDSELGSSKFGGFQVERITVLNADQPADAVQPVSPSDRGLITLIDNSLTLMLVVGVLICLIPFYRRVAPWTAHPAFWLACMGLFGFAIAPAVVAGAMLLLAIALPVFPTKRWV